ncbi:MAG: shikimate dehydrogenase [Reyranellaceae bacterium]
MAEVPISGATRVLTIIGHPTLQIRSTTTLNGELRRRGIDAVLVPVDLDPTAVAAFLQTLRGWHNAPGCIVTVPHKSPCAALVDETTERARLLGAVNLIRRSDRGRLTGDMVDGLGFIAALRANRFEPAGKNAMVFGAGAVGRALLLSLAEAGIQRIAFSDPDAGRVAALMDLARTARVDDRISAGTVDDLGAVDLAVNASPVGMNGEDRMPFDPARLPRHAMVADVVTKPVETPLLRAAKAHGCRIQTGLEMSDAQATMQLDFFGLLPADGAP